MEAKFKSIVLFSVHPSNWLEPPYVSMRTFDTLLIFNLPDVGQSYQWCPLANISRNNPFLCFTFAGLLFANHFFSPSWAEVYFFCLHIDF